jgi:NADH-quinone oxidoreductase subunit G
VLSAAGAVYIAAADPAGDDPALAAALNSAGFVVVQDLFLTETARLADVVFPAQSFIEREGTFTSGERRVQRFYAAVAPLHGPRPDFRIISDAAKQAGYEVEGRAASLITAAIAREVTDYAEVTYPRLAQVHDQWPIVHREDLFYGGTSYHNRQGLGVQLPGRVETVEPALPGPGAPAAAPQNGEVLVVPVARLYDRGTTLVPSALLHARMARAEAWMNPGTASRLGLEQNSQAQAALESGSHFVMVKLDETLPDGVALIARSAGVPISAPQVVKLERVAQEAAV